MANATLSPGQMLGKYKVTSHIANGAMGMVYRARDTKLNRDVALKVLFPHLTGDPNLMRRFQREAQTIAQLDHPNIVALYDTDNADGYHYIAMQFIDGASLGSRLRQGGARPSVRDTLEVARQVGGALAYAHTRGLVHRDVKPDNILCSKDGRYYLTDFSIVQLADGTHLTQTFASLGTPAYMSPEQGQGNKVIDHRSDIYSFGVVLYELLAGTPPFEATTPIGVVMKHINEPPPPLNKRRPDLPADLRKFIEKALAKKASDRHQSASDLVRGAEQLLANGGTVKSNDEHRLRWLLAGVAVIVLAVGGVVTMALLANRADPSATATATVVAATSATSVPASGDTASATPAPTDAPTTVASTPTTLAPAAATETGLPTSTQVALPTETPRPTRTPLPSATPLPTLTETPTVTPTPTASLTPTRTPSPTVTRTRAPRKTLVIIRRTVVAPKATLVLPNIATVPVVVIVPVVVPTLKIDPQPQPQPQPTSAPPPKVEPTSAPPPATSAPPPQP